MILMERAAAHHAGTKVVDGTGTRRRLAALVYLGWTQTQLADRVEMAARSIGQILGGTATVHAATAHRVCALYDELWDQPPPETTPAQQAAAAAARRYARDHQWAPAMAWDDDQIDNPKARPHGIRKDT